MQYVLLSRVFLWGGERRIGWAPEIVETYRREGGRLEFSGEGSEFPA